MIKIEKLTAPTNISNKEEQGTIWIADLESGKQVWRQESPDGENPNWTRFGDIYEKRCIETNNFIQL